jgi:hypothetical protein
MAKKHDQEYGQQLFSSLQRIAAGNRQHPATPPAPEPHPLALFPPPPRELRKMKKFRFQLLHRWLVERFEPCRAADIGGGKGLLAYLLQESGWETAVIDPTPQSLPHKYKNITTGQRIRTPAGAAVRHIDQEFDGAMAEEFDLLIGMHAHGCNALIIDAATKLGCGFILFPCCVIDEPFYPPIGTTWLESVADYAVRQGHHIYPFRLNFKGQNIGLAAIGRCKQKLQQA